MCLTSLKPKAAILLPFSLSLVANPPASAQSQKNINFCDYIVRIEQGDFDRRSNDDDFLCDGTLVENPVDLELYCLNSGNTLFLDGADMIVDLAACERSSNQTNAPTVSGICAIDTTERHCNVPKGPETEQFVIIQPDTISGTRPEISWEAVDNTENYTVYVTGHNLSWQREVGGDITTLPYPEDKTSLTIGTAYEIGVYANIANSEEYAVASTLVNVQETITLLNIPSSSKMQSK